MTSISIINLTNKEYVAQTSFVQLLQVQVFGLTDRQTQANRHTDRQTNSRQTMQAHTYIQTHIAQHATQKQRTSNQKSDMNIHV
jgi:hypothetical protein